MVIGVKEVVALAVHASVPREKQQSIVLLRALPTEPVQASDDVGPRGLLIGETFGLDLGEGAAFLRLKDLLHLDGVLMGKIQLEVLVLILRDADGQKNQV